MTSTKEYTPQVIDPFVMIEVYESELTKAQENVTELKRKISMLKKSKGKGMVTKITDFDLQVANLKWRKEIRGRRRRTHLRRASARRC